MRRCSFAAVCYLRSLLSYATLSEAEKAISSLEGTEINGRPLHARLDRSSVTESTGLNHQVFVGNLPWAFSTVDLAAIFKPFNPIECKILTNMYGKSRGFAIVKFLSEEDADIAVAQLANMVLNDRVIEVVTWILSLLFAVFFSP
jgi:RNA recognition motif-containing protein